jgi:hypothetical protein
MSNQPSDARQGLPAPRVDSALRKQIIEFMAASALMEPSAALAAASAAFDRMSVADLQVVEMNMRLRSQQAPLHDDGHDYAR